MSFKELMNAVTCGRAAISATELELGKIYKVRKVKVPNTTFKTVIFDLGEVDIWVPKRYSEQLTPEIIADINSGKEEITIR